MPLQGLAGGDASAPLLLQLLNQHMGQPQAPLPTYMAAQQAAAAAAPEYRRSSNADLAVPQPLQPQTAGYAAAAAAKQRASKSGSYVDDVEEDLLAAGMLHSGQSHEEEEYAAVFVSMLLPHCWGWRVDEDQQRQQQLAALHAKQHPCYESSAWSFIRFLHACAHC